MPKHAHPALQARVEAVEPAVGWVEEFALDGKEQGQRRWAKATDQEAVHRPAEAESWAEERHIMGLVRVGVVEEAKAFPIAGSCCGVVRTGCSREANLRDGDLEVADAMDVQIEHELHAVPCCMMTVWSKHHSRSSPFVCWKSSTMMPMVCPPSR